MNSCAGCLRVTGHGLSAMPLPQLALRDAQLIRACETANQDADVMKIQMDFDGIRDEMAEPWN